MEHTVKIELTITSDLSAEELDDRLSSYVSDVLEVEGIRNDDSLTGIEIEGYQIGFEKLTVE